MLGLSLAIMSRSLMSLVYPDSIVNESYLITLSEGGMSDNKQVEMTKV